MRRVAIFPHLSFDGESIDGEQLSTLVGGEQGQIHGRTCLDNKPDRNTDRRDEKVVDTHRRGGGPSGGCCPIGNISTIINHVWKHWGNPPTPTALQAIPDHSPINGVIISASVPAALTHTHTHTKKKPWHKMVQLPFRKRKEKKKTVIGSLSLSLLSQNFSAPLLCRARPPQHCAGARSDRGEHTPYLSAALWDPELVMREEICGLSLSMSCTGSDKKRKEAVNSLFPAAGSFPLLFWFAVCALSVLLVMLIVSRPPAECDPFPGWVAVKLFAQADESACMLLLFLCVCVCVCLQRGATMCHKSFSYAAHVGLCVIMHVGAHQHGSPRSQPRLGTPYSPILQTLACEDGKQADVSS